MVDEAAGDNAMDSSAHDDDGSVEPTMVEGNEDGVVEETNREPQIEEEEEEEEEEENQTFRDATVDPSDNDLGDADEQKQSTGNTAESIKEYSPQAANKATVDNPTTSTRPPLVLETPPRRIKHSKFVFLSDQKSVPRDLRKLQEHTIKRRRDLLAKMHDADCHMARIMSKYVEEKMDLELVVSDTFERTVAHPLASAVERLAIQREASNSRILGVANLDRRVGQLDVQMTHHVHVTMSDIKHDELDSFHDELHQDVVPGLRVENSMYDKVEGGIVRRYEMVAGEIAKNLHAEGASRRASIESLRQKVEKLVPSKTDGSTNTLSQIAMLRAQLRQERADRQAADQAILESIAHTTERMKRAMMALVSDGEIR